MEKAIVFIEDRVQDVGYRVFVMERLLESNLDGGAINTLDGWVKVLVEGERDEILAFFERLKKEKPELSEKVVMTEPEFDSSLSIPDKIALCHSLQMNQFGKAVNFLAKMSEQITDSRKDNKENFSKLNENINGLRDETKEFREEMRENFLGLRDETKEFREEMRENFLGLRDETKEFRRETSDNFVGLDKKYGSVSKYLKSIDKHLKQLNKNIVMVAKAALSKSKA